MGEVYGFLQYKRETAGYRQIQERLEDYKEIIYFLEENKLFTQGARCMECGIPYCHSIGCPSGNLIPEWNDYVSKGQWREAYERLEITNNFPEITGRICPALCEASCSLSINDAPVTIKQIELAIIEKAFAEDWVKAVPPQKESGKSIAIVGSGPAGLAAAQQLRRSGHTVTVFERNNEIGGILRYGIPDFKLDKGIIDRRLKILKEEGVRFETNALIGEDISADFLKRKHDIVLLTTGAHTPRSLPISGIDLDEIYYALDYLTDSNQFISGEKEAHQIISAKDKVVLVIGGGDTGSDCVGTANRQGAKKIYQFEIMPKPIEWNEPWNPQWPDWPQILRTSSSHEEGCERRWSVLTKKFMSRSVQVEEGHFCEVNWKKDSKGKMFMEEIPGTEFSLKVDMVLLATGFVHVEHSRLLEDLEIAIDQKGNIAVDETFMTNIPGVFAAGDSVKGASLVIHAIHQGREAANYINQYIQ
ncbi:MAG: glutamate synthase subunit beta [Spirochaetes bacterium]|nr:glutamate synthase subunit beta [Spirochaetota bacterium]